SLPTRRSSDLTRSHAALVTATVGLCFQTHTRLATHVKGTNTFGAISLVRGEGHQIDLHLLQIDLDLAGGLCRVDMQQHAAGTGQLADGSDVVDGADFVVDVHDRHQNGVLTQRGFDHGRCDQAIFARLQIGHFETFALELTSGIQYRLVLDLRGDDVLALAGVEMRRALDCEVVGLGGTTGPDDFARVGIDQLGDLTTSILHRFFGFPAKYVRARSRVAEVTVDQQAFAHLLRDTRINRRCGGVVEVNGQFHWVSPIRQTPCSLDGRRFNLIQMRRSAPAGAATLILAQRDLLNLTAHDQIGQTDATEELMNLLTEIAPQMMGQTGVAGVAVALPLATGG